MATLFDVFWIAMQFVMLGTLAGGAYLTLGELFRGGPNGGYRPTRSVAGRLHMGSESAKWNA